MTFALDAATLQMRDRVRAAAAALAAAAATADASAAWPDSSRRQAIALLPAGGDRLGRVVALEELAAVSASLALAAATGTAAPASGAPAWSGLRGLDVPGARTALDGPDGVLTVAAVLVGLSRAAIDAALVPLRAARAAGGRPEQEHWGFADAATELDAARLLLWQAAAGGRDATAAAMARLQARIAAEAAVAAARRGLGADGVAAGSVVDRVSRDVATAALVFGGADTDEAAVAAGVLPG